MHYTQEMDQYIREIAKGRLCADIAEMFNEKFGTNVTAVNIKQYKSNHKIRSGRSSIDYSKKTYYNQLLNAEQTEFLKSIYLGISNRECTRLMNEKFGLSLTCTQVKGQKRRLKLDSGLDGRFKKGQKPNNCFKKGERNSIETEFKKGNLPHNWVPVGTEKIKGDGYVYVKISDVRGVKYAHTINWKPKHKIVWEQKYGPIPDDCCLIFLDGNKTNVTVENLACITKQQRLIMCKKHLTYDDASLTKAGINIAKLFDAINKKSRKDQSNDKRQAR